MSVRELWATTVLLAVRTMARTFWRVESRWIGDVPEGDPWAHVRVVAILHHTSLFEPIFAAVAPFRFLVKLARHGVIPIADITANRPIAGLFFKSLTAHVVSISRQRDYTWREVLAKIEDPKRIVALLPEGRMMRANGLDKTGRPMTVRAGIADILLATPDGRMLLGYSAGLHHIHCPGEGLPRLFKTARIQLEVVDIEEYRERLLAEHGEGGFHAAVIADLTRRRDTHCHDWTAA